MERHKVVGADMNETKRCAAMPCWGGDSINVLIIPHGTGTVSVVYRVLFNDVTGTERSKQQSQCSRQTYYLGELDC